MFIRKYVFLSLILLGLGLFSGVLAGPSQQATADLIDEESEQYYKKWVEQDVVYIIQRQEKEIFDSLTTDQEKEEFIEQFWRRRDPDLTTAANEFKEEHYRRLAYVNERYASGEAGWKTDRGRIYIIHGPPDEIDPHPSGGAYERTLYEGGGMTATFPFEVWRYRHIDGVGDDVILEFVDPSWSGQYKLTIDPDEKDAFARAPLGETLDEMDGLMLRGDRGTRLDTRIIRRQDMPFDRYYRYRNVQRAPTIKYKDLQEMVKVELTYDSFPFEIRVDHFRLNQAQVLIPVTIEVQNKDLTFVDENGLQVARVAIYGIITSIKNQVVTEFEDELVNRFSMADIQRGRTQRSLYQKIIPVERGMRYKLDVVVKDLNTERSSVNRVAIAPPSFGDEKFAVSSVILSDYMRVLDEIPDGDEMFVIGDVWVRPSISNVFWNVNALGAYYQLYNFALDQSDLEPRVRITYEIFRDGERIVKMSDENAEAQYFSQQRIVLIRRLPIEQLEPGPYTLNIAAEDLVKDETATTSVRFEVQAPPQAGTN
jgi:GWxTD domain-containing protein